MKPLKQHANLKLLECKKAKVKEKKGIPSGYRTQ